MPDAAASRSRSRAADLDQVPRLNRPDGTLRMWVLGAPFIGSIRRPSGARYTGNLSWAPARDRRVPRRATISAST